MKSIIADALALRSNCKAFEIFQPRHYNFHMRFIIRETMNQIKISAFSFMIPFDSIIDGTSSLAFNIFIVGLYFLVEGTFEFHPKVSSTSFKLPKAFFPTGKF